MIPKEDLLDFMCAVEAKVGCSVYVAGGYLRDMDNGVAPKDIDIMVVSSQMCPRGFVDSISEMDGFMITSELVEACEYMSDMAKRKVVGLVNGEISKHATIVDFVLYGEDFDQEHVTSDMDINVCQITMDSSGKIARTVEYMDGFKNMEIVCMHDYSHERQQSRLKRMLAKYPEFAAPQLES